MGTGLVHGAVGAGETIELSGVAAGRLQRRDLLDLLLHLLTDRLVIVQVKIPEGRHAQDRAGVDVHHDPGRAVAQVILLYGG